jgi:hypothetical protein
MWRIVDHTQGRVRSVLTREWGREAASDALERSHCYGAATEIAHELAYLGLEPHKDFDVSPTRMLTLVLQ